MERLVEAAQAYYLQHGFAFRKFAGIDDFCEVYDMGNVPSDTEQRENLQV